MEDGEGDQARNTRWIDVENCDINAHSDEVRREMDHRSLEEQSSFVPNIIIDSKIHARDQNE